MTVRVEPRMVVRHAEKCDGTCNAACVEVQDGWTAHIYVRLSTDVYKRERVRTPATTRRGAEDWAQKRAAHLLTAGPEKVEVKEQHSPTFADFAPRFLAHAHTNNKPSTARGKLHALENHLLPCFGAMRLSRIGPAEIEAFKARQKGLALSPKSINNQLAVLGKVLSLAVEWGELKAAPKIAVLRAPPPPFEFLDFEEAERFQAAVAPAWQTMTQTALKTGLRPGELRALQWPDVHLDARQIVVSRTLWRGLEGSPKGGRSRTVDLCETALAALKTQQLSTRLRRRYVFSPDGGETPYTEKQIEHVVHVALAAVGIPKDMSWHGLRHTFASHLAMLGTPLVAIQVLLGHEDIKMTLRYAHLSPSRRVDMVRGLDLPAPVAAPPAEKVAAGWQAEKRDDKP